MILAVWEILSIILFGIAIWLIAFVLIARTLAQEYFRDFVMVVGYVALVTAITIPFIALYDWLMAWHI
jgi:hypothetical protein